MKAINKERYGEIMSEYESAMNYHRYQKLWYRNEFGIRAPGIEYTMNQDERIEWARCYNDIFYLIENYCKFLTVEGKSYIKLYDFQKNMISDLINNRYVCFYGSRQVGMDVVIASYLIYNIITGNKRRVFAFTAGHATAVSRDLMGKIMEIYKSIPFYLKPGVVTKTQDFVEFENGVIVSTTNGYRYWTYSEDDKHDPKKEVDEFIGTQVGYFNKIGENEITSMIPLISEKTDGKVILTTTGQSSNESFNGIVRDSLRPDTDPRKNAFKSTIVHWHQIPSRGKEWMEEQKKMLGSEEQFRKEYDISLAD